MITEIYYFSGTGNSLQVVHEIQKRLPEVIAIPIVHSLHFESIRSSAQSVGFVFPNFCLSIPIPLHDFLVKADLSSAEYLFAVCTRGGSPSQAFAYINQLLIPQKKELQAWMNISMPWNHPLGKENLPEQNSQEKVKQLERAMQNKLAVFCQVIQKQETYLPADHKADLALSSGIKLYELLVSKSFNFYSHKFMYQKLMHFYVDEKCTGCGICEQVCLSKKIELINQQPVWRQEVDCYACYACINYCPRQAVQVQSSALIKSFTKQTGRYHHPDIIYKEIAAQRSPDMDGASNKKD